MRRWVMLCNIACSTSGGLQCSPQWLCLAGIGFSGSGGIGYSLHLQVQTVSLASPKSLSSAQQIWANYTLSFWYALEILANADKWCSLTLLASVTVSSWSDLLGPETKNIFFPTTLVKSHGSMWRQRTPMRRSLRWSALSDRRRTARVQQPLHSQHAAHTHHFPPTPEHTTASAICHLQENWWRKSWRLTTLVRKVIIPYTIFMLGFLVSLLSLSAWWVS